MQPTLLTFPLSHEEVQLRGRQRRIAYEAAADALHSLQQLTLSLSLLVQYTDDLNPAEVDGLLGRARQFNEMAADLARWLTLHDDWQEA